MFHDVLVKQELVCLFDRAGHLEMVLGLAELWFLKATHQYEHDLASTRAIIEPVS